MFIKPPERRPRNPTPPRGASPGTGWGQAARAGGVRAGPCGCCRTNSRPSRSPLSSGSLGLLDSSNRRGPPRPGRTGPRAPPAAPPPLRLAQLLPLGQAGPFSPHTLSPHRRSPVPSLRTPAPLNAPEPRCHGRSPTGHPPASPPLRPPGPLRPRSHVPAPSGPPPGPARTPRLPRRPSLIPRSRAGVGRSRPSNSGRRTGPAAATPPPSSLPASPAPRARRGADGGRGGTEDNARCKRGGRKRAEGAGVLSYKVSGR